MAKNKKEEYKEQNLLFLEETASQEGVYKLPCGVLYKVLEQGTGTVSPQLSSVVTVHYRGTLINGREFDNSWKRSCPEAFRLNQVIEGWQQALQQMHVGDKWIVYIPYTLGYGNRPSGPIPAFSTLVFEVELLGIA
ncbi:FKBP-type peptidyl-prolyl cis-trans isomerase [Parabacteroides gordonii]|jgi:peptidylprolyl isomerase|uniref:FKBP-type peptidyl-prolyl cis-trans isomerase n=1 Tax=Parabacteroides gordonii TaxID=574930 RepID=UPI000EBBFFC1|nr:FKBP-type peptidyl-prolyl cis-trans isomerase [Parabacteroides gordonii]RGP08496.1 FKBP-type peptidyl-prolyl cis-trans isomerase [Parabacteroides gordonii]